VYNVGKLIYCIVKNKRKEFKDPEMEGTFFSS
jgi:hypothetical protein